MKKLLALFIFFICVVSQPVLAQGPGLDDYVEGENLRKARRYKDAIDKFTAALDKEPTNYMYLYSQAQCFYNTREIDATIAALDKAISAKNDFVPVYLLKAKAHKIKKEWEKVDENLDMAFKYETDPDKKVDYKISVMNRLVKMGQFEKAYEKIKEARDITPTNESVVYFFAKISNKLGKYEEAKKAIKAIEPKISGQEPKESAKYYYELGSACYYLGQYKEANIALEKANFGPFVRKIRKFSAKYFCSIAGSYMKVYENELAKEYVDRALQVQESYPSAHVYSAVLSKRGKEQTETLNSLKLAVGHETDFIKKVNIYNQMAELQLQSGDYKGCLATTDESLKIKDDPDAAFEKCVALYKMQNYKQTIATAEEMIKRISDKKYVPDFQFLLGLAYKKDSQLEKAKMSFYKTMQSSLSDAAEIESALVSKELSKQKKP